MDNADQAAREILAKITGMSVDEPLDRLTQELIFGGKKPSARELYKLRNSEIRRNRRGLEEIRKGVMGI